MSKNESISNWVHNNLIIKSEDREFIINFRQNGDNIEEELMRYGTQINLNSYQNNLLANFSSKLIRNVSIDENEKIKVEDIQN